MGRMDNHVSEDKTMKKKGHIITFDNENAKGKDISDFKDLWDYLKIKIECLENEYKGEFIQ